MLTQATGSRLTKAAQRSLLTNNANSEREQRTGTGRDVGLTELAEHVQGTSHRLRALHMANNRIGDAGALALAHILSSLPDLRVLNLAGNRIGDQGASALAVGLLPVEQQHDADALKEDDDDERRMDEYSEHVDDYDPD
jgi:Ran GTPase-activating protein (RanGAP) involved in mRNA processing and transport